LETGSLIRLKKNVQDIIIPSEEDHIEMFPLDFEEFLWLNEAIVVNTCYNAADPHIPFEASDLLRSAGSIHTPFPGVQGSTHI
jgi:hypothetical protein